MVLGDTLVALKWTETWLEERRPWRLKFFAKSQNRF
jgi:hypothetical protein